MTPRVHLLVTPFRYHHPAVRMIPAACRDLWHDTLSTTSPNVDEVTCDQCIGTRCFQERLAVDAVKGDRDG